MAESFGSGPERYDRSRPRYPDPMVLRIVAASPGPDVLDVGCGTGIAARQFQATGCRVLGVEPDVRMAEFAQQRGLAVEVATFEGWDPAGRAFDAVIAGQSWHWVDPIAGAAKAAAVMRPAGRLAVFRSDPRPPSDLADAFAAASHRVLPEALAARVGASPPTNGSSALSTSAADGIRQVSAFGEAEEWRFDWEQSYARDEWLDGLPTQGFYTRLAPDKLEQLLADTGAAIDAVGGRFTMRYTTTVITATSSTDETNRWPPSRSPNLHCD
jgi:SAM-dependent methyltransferase